MSVKITDNTASTKSNIDRQTALLVRMAMDSVIKHSTPKTPKKDGNLRRNIKKMVSGKKGVLSWEADYAKYQERGFTTGKVRKYTTAGTGKGFAQYGIDQMLKEFPVIATKAYKDWN